jgi:hypothetical protein
MKKNEDAYVTAKPALQHSSGTWELSDEVTMRTEGSEMRFLWPLLGVWLRDKTSPEVRKQLGTKQVEEGGEEYRRK